MGDGHHHHAHDHGVVVDFGRAFALGVALNLGFVAIELTCGLLAGSVALLADAGHNLSDVLGLAVAWGGAALARRPASPRFTYGLRKSSILAALANALFLLLACGGIGWEAARRFADPPPVPGGVVMAVAAVGIAVNAVTAWLFASGRHGDINIRAAYLHMVSDAAVSAAVVVAGGLVLLTGWAWIDPAASLVVVAVILWGTWGLLRDSIGMALDAVPTSVDAGAVGIMLRGLDGVERVHDLHIWPISTTEVALTVRLVMPGGHPGDAFLHAVEERLEHDFGVDHSTIQIGLGGADACQLHGAWA
ncbi:MULTISPECIES: cation diffusion facilitator family transporter [Sphingomonas]|uniref:cation diffusion facilitator family transporter n=1 Tax=Sphingomonas TaxID=13687 RepID=UPI0008353DFA|nr:cation diffusion facilitator family transporter [Sphingomonas sp. CCH10-B3]